MPALLETSLKGLPPTRRGKVRELYDLGAAVLIVSTDRISAFDVVMANGVPDKGKVLNQMSAFWFEKLKTICPHHLISANGEEIANRSGISDSWLAGRTMLAKKANPLPIECVARGYLSGSLFKEYQANGSRIHGLPLPEGLVEGSKLDEAIFTPATKAQSGHDQNISFEQATDLVGKEVAELVRKWTLQLYCMAADFALTKGLILADTKFEFGTSDDGIIWIDEALTPDSSRYWDVSKWIPGQTQPSYDKQFVRDYLEQIAWNKLPPGPELPEEIIQRTRKKYLEAFRRITEKELTI